jgi:hypothetical protein
VGPRAGIENQLKFMRNMSPPEQAKQSTPYLCLIPVTLLPSFVFSSTVKMEAIFFFEALVTI